MAQQGDLYFSDEKQFLGESYRDSVNELRKISWFIKVFIKMNQESKIIYGNKDYEKDIKIDMTKKTNSFFFLSLNNIFNSFDSFVENSNKSFSEMENDLLQPLDDFIVKQLKLYNQNLKKMGNLSTVHKKNKLIIDNAKNNYYFSSYKSNQLDDKEQKDSIFRGENDSGLIMDKIIRKKMIARNDENIFKYEISKYNKYAGENNDEYNSLINNILDLERTKVEFVNSLLTKFKKYLTDYVTLINNFIGDIDKYNTKEIGDQDILLQTKFLNKYKEEMKDKNQLRIPKMNFMSYQNYLELKKPKKETLANMKLVNINPQIKLDENDLINKIKDFVNNLLEENDIGQEKVADIFELLYFPNYDVGKKILNYLYEKKGMSSIVFLNIQNLVYLANILGYISLHENSIFNEQFDLNLKIIFIAERIFYRKKLTNDKIYLSALLSKNKYYRTKEFWRNIVEFKLANKLDDHIERIKNNKINDNKKKGIFKRWFSGNSNKSFLEKVRIFPLIKNYNSLDSEKIELLEKIAIQEMQTLIRENIPIFANFNFTSELCLDLIAELTEEYKIEKDNMKFFVTYFNVSNYTIRKLIPNEKGNTINIYKQYISLPEINKKLKLFKNIVPFLNFKDYNNLLLCSKLFHKKLSKIIYKYVLKQKNLSLKIRLSIWQNLLGISSLKKTYNYKEVLSSAKDDRLMHEIELDVIRTTVGEVKNPNEIRKQVANVLFAVAQLNGKTRYCQGMNFIVQFLHEKFGEEEAFYIFLSFFKNTDYRLIFEKNLEELKILFYVFRRVISLLEPELSSYFNSNGIDVNFFVSPWFITLFTGSHQHFKGENDNSQILLRILDNFIVSGLKSLMEVGCVALHSYENVLMSKRYEDMMQFLINDMLRSDFFSKKNTEFVENYFNETKISKKLVKNIEEEFRQEQKFNLLKK